MTNSNTQLLLERRRRLLGPAYRLFYERPLHLVRGEGCWLFDSDGGRYLDAYNNVAHVGHGNPVVVEAIRQQAAALNTHTRYLHENVLDLSEQLLSRMPAGPWHALYACSGTEANDLALRIARSVTGNDGVIVTSFAYHGHSVAIAPLSTDMTPPERRGSHIATLPAPNLYRCPVAADQATDHYLAELDKAVDTLARQGHAPAALFMDTVFSSEGLPTLPEGFLAAAADRVRAAGGLFVADEVQAGFGRLGSHFFGFDRHHARPDLVTLGKPMGNGHPVSAVLARAGLVEDFSGEGHYFNTFGGNPVSCAAALAVLQEMETHDLQANAARQGALLAEALKDLADRYDAVGDVRGSGLFIGVDLVKDRDTRTADPQLAKNIVNRLRETGVLMGVTGPGENVLKIRPPLVFGDEERGFLMDQLDSAFAAATGKAR